MEEVSSLAQHLVSSQIVSKMREKREFLSGTRIIPTYFPPLQTKLNAIYIQLNSLTVCKFIGHKTYIYTHT